MPLPADSSLSAQARQRLRERAAGLSIPPKPLDASTLAAVPELVRELQVNQLELAMQYEALRAAQADADAERAASETARTQYDHLYDFAPVALFTLGADGCIAQLNERASRLLGSTGARLTGRRFLLFVAPDSQKEFEAFLANIFGSQLRHTVELHMQTHAGTRFVANLSGQLCNSTDGPPTAQLAVMDATALSQEMERRQHSEERLHLALAASGTGVWVWTMATNTLEWDAQAQACFGRPHDPNPTSFEVLQTALHPDDVLPMQRALRATVTRGQSLDIEHRVQWPDGSVHHLAAHGKVQYNAQGQPECLIGLIRDVTPRYLAVAELDYRNRQLQELLDNMPMLFARLSPTGQFLELAGAGRQRLGITDSSGLVGKSVYDTFPNLTEPVRRLLAGEAVSFIGLIEVLGQPVYFQNYGFFDQQRQQGVIFAIDVTESEQMRFRLSKEQRFTKSLLDHYVDGVLAFDRTGRLTAWNRVMEALTGLAEADALGQDVFACLPFGQASVPGEIITDLLHGSSRPRFHQPFTWAVPAVEFEVTAISLPNEDGAGGAGGLLMLRDVTSRNRLHANAARIKAEQQREIFRMVLMAQEVERERIAEALHNGVGQLLYATKLRLSEGEKTHGAMELLEEAIKATRNVSFELTPRILEDFGLAAALHKLAQSIPPEKLRLQLYLSGLQCPLPKVLTVAVYRMVQELLNNVVKHSRAEEATLHVVYEDDHVHISMEDDGSGFDVATALGQAKGIGLAALSNRVALLGGLFDLTSRPGRGTIATLTLPVVE
ncbi:sensor histidine kinase [Hymenobacter terrenus]|uniref:sensor histidine kinase n=1 Tax=Hymenobacter terrenus TaxID=1629124 RepID=UPI00061951DE|nr:PAS domain S-box protein [Hymenobacter terrenus]